MKNKKRTIIICVWAGVILLLLAGVIMTEIFGAASDGGDVKEAMRDAVLHGANKISLLGLIDVNPALVSAVTVTFVLLLFAAVVRIFVIPRFKRVPGKFQLVIEQAVGMFDGMARNNSPHRNRFLGAYIFGAAAFIFVGTLFELIGIQAQTTAGAVISLPAPLSDINAAIALGCLSYVIILAGGIAGRGARGFGRALKEFALPLSMSFRLFGAMLSGLLVTELVYQYLALSFVLPAVVGVLFTLLHALVQAYVLTYLTSMFYGEVSEPRIKKPKANHKT